MEKIIHWGFRIVGTRITTNNQEAMVEKTIEAAWGNFMKNALYNEISWKISNEIFWLYCHFEKDFTNDSMNKNYDLVIGCKVSNDMVAPEWMVAIDVPEASYMRYEAKWAMPDAVIHTWEKIWTNPNLQKNYTFDYEVYWEKAQNWDQSEAEVFVGVD